MKRDYSHQLPDPESFEWNLFDDNYRRQLDQRPYVSPSHDRKYGIAQEESKGLVASNTALSATDSNDGKGPATTKERSRIFDDEQDLEFDEPPSDEDDAEIPEGSLFDHQIPGVLSKDEVKRLDLDHWRLVVRNALIELEVRAVRAALIELCY